MLFIFYLLSFSFIFGGIEHSVVKLYCAYDYLYRNEQAEEIAYDVILLRLFLHIFPSILTTSQANSAYSEYKLPIENSEYFMNNVIFQ